MPGLIKFLTILAVIAGFWWAKRKLQRYLRDARDRPREGVEDLTRCPTCGVWRSGEGGCNCNSDA